MAALWRCSLSIGPLDRVPFPVPGQAVRQAIARHDHRKGQGHALVRPLGPRRDVQRRLEGRGHEGLQVQGPFAPEIVEEHDGVLSLVVMYDMELSRVTGMLVDEPAEALRS